MNKLLKIALVLLLLISAAFAEESRPATWAKAISNQYVKNFYLVDSGLYRAAQPDKAAMIELERMGVKTILNLRNNHDDRDEAKGTKLKLLSIPINTWEINDAAVVKALRILTDKNNYPLLVHCQHGADRTGTIMAMYRIVVQGWSKEEALKELMEGGYGYHSVWINIPKYIKGVDINKLKEQLIIAQ